MSMAQVGIQRLPARRPSEQPREAMNCKSCRKRKIKCNRLRPSCEACQIFACPCVYDAVPKKRGPKTDVLEALLKRVDGLEKQLRTERKDGDAEVPVSDVKEAILEEVRKSVTPRDPEERPLIPALERGDSANSSPNDGNPRPVEHAHDGPSPSTSHSSTGLPNIVYGTILLDTYFSRVHGKPYHILDEQSTRQRLASNHIPEHLTLAIFAVSARYTANYGGYDEAARNAHNWARRARAELDVDEPSIEGLQTLLLLSQEMFQEGAGKKTLMYLSTAVSMALALNLHRELPAMVQVTPNEREARRRLFWSCYLLDRFAACGSKRPSLIADECILLRMPSCTLPSDPVGYYEGDFFSTGNNLQFNIMSGIPLQGGTGMLIGISRILGNTNRYLAAGGVKGDSHFPWHALSTLSKIRQELDIWASDTQDIFSSIEKLFGHPYSVVLVLSKLIYHLIHCLIYRPFMPIDLAELATASQHQSWQIEATNLCFLHANAIAELVEIGKTSGILDWPAFVSYCICTAGTIHVHGSHYQGRAGEVFSMSADFLSRELQQLTELQFIWGGTQHQKNILQTLYTAHSELIASFASNPVRFSPVFQMEDFFDRYPGYSFDGAHIAMHEIFGQPTQSQQYEHMVTRNGEQPRLHRSYSEQGVLNHISQPTGLASNPNMERPSHKRRATESFAESSALFTAANSMKVPANGSFATNLVTGNSFALDQAGNFNNSTPAYYNNYQAPDMPSNPSFSTPPTGLANNFMPMGNAGAEQSSIPTLPSQQTYGFTSGIAEEPDAMMQGASGAYDPASEFAGMQQEESDPFLSLLEQLAENEQNRGGPSELDFFLSGTG